MIARLCVLLVAALVLAGCGGDDEEPRATATASPTPTPFDPTIAADSLLTVADFPQGWVEEPNPRPKDTQCEAAQAAVEASSGRADSGRFTDQTFPSVIGSVYLYEDEAAAEQAYKALGDTATHECVGEEFARLIGEQLGIEIGKIETEPLTIGDYAASRLNVEATFAGIAAEAVLDVVVARSGRGITFWAFVSSQTPFDESVRDDLMATAVDRLASNLG